MDMIHVSDILHAQRCKRYAWNIKNNRLKQEGFYHLDMSFSSLWSRFLKVEESVKGQVGDSNEKSEALLKENDWVRFARFEYRGLRTKIALIRKHKEGLDLYYPYLSAYPKENEIINIQIDVKILENLGYKICNIYSVYLNKDYVREEELDIDQLFVLNDALFNRRNKANKTIVELLEACDPIDLDEMIRETDKIIHGDPEDPVRTKGCTSQRKCAYYDFCFNEKDEPNDSILFLTTSRNKLDAYEMGVRRICDMDPDLFEGFPLQYAQYMASKEQRPFCDLFALDTWTETIQYPISYLDFEWDTFPIPPYSGMRPFDVLCFQYSLHVETQEGSLSHMDFFSTGDCRQAFIESLLENVPKEGSILVYNMEGAEKLRLIQLGLQFPQYAEQLKQIYSRMIDLSKPFEHGLYYNNAMRGHFSLKNVMPVFSSDYSYKDLDIQDGMNAVHAYRHYDQANEEEKQYIQHAIRVYCMMDTYAEYIVLHGLLDYMKELEKEAEYA